MMTKLKKYLIPVAAILLLSWAWQSDGWEGVSLALTGFVMWLLMHFTNMMLVLRRARNRPMGYVDSAVMFQSKLKEGMPMLHVLALSRSLGALQSPPGQQPEVFLWKDSNDNRVTAVFVAGKLESWIFKRPKLILPDAVDEATGETANETTHTDR